MNYEILLQHQLLELGLIDIEQFDLNMYYITSLSDNRIITANQH